MRGNRARLLTTSGRLHRRLRLQLPSTPQEIDRFFGTRSKVALSRSPSVPPKPENRVVIDSLHNPAKELAMARSKTRGPKNDGATTTALVRATNGPLTRVRSDTSAGSGRVTSNSWTASIVSISFDKICHFGAGRGDRTLKGL